MENKILYSFHSYNVSQKGFRGNLVHYFTNENTETLEEKEMTFLGYLVTESGQFYLFIQ